jgi:major membrane immunogen (membrane-anchored lipoprotein)
MKKIIFLFAISMLLACSKSDENKVDTINQNKITPPVWIQGTWLNVFSTNPFTATPFCKFTNSDFCVISSSLENCIAQSIQQASQAGASTNVQQTITDNNYKLTYTIQGQTSTYQFIKISNTKIEYVNPTVGLPNLSLTKQ